jgi:hypothetical protein
MLKSFTIYDAAGTILSSGHVLAEDLPLQLANYPDAYLIEEESDPSTDKIDTVNKTVLKNQKLPEPEPVKLYDENRAKLYPPTHEQLDMLWHAMDNGTMAKAEPFYSYIKAVKSAYPKDNSAPQDSVTIIPADNIP